MFYASLFRSLSEDFIRENWLLMLSLQVKTFAVRLQIRLVRQLSALQVFVIHSFIHCCYVFASRRVYPSSLSVSVPSSSRS